MSIYKDYLSVKVNFDNENINLFNNSFGASISYGNANDLKSPFEDYDEWLLNDLKWNISFNKSKKRLQYKTSDLVFNEISHDCNHIIDTSSVDAWVDEDQVSIYSKNKSRINDDLYCSSESINYLSSPISSTQVTYLKDFAQNNNDYNLLVEKLLSYEEGGNVKLRQWKNTSSKVIDEIVNYKLSKGKILKDDIIFLANKYNLEIKKVRNIIKNHQNKKKHSKY